MIIFDWFRALVQFLFYWRDNVRFFIFFSNREQIEKQLFQIFNFVSFFFKGKEEWMLTSAWIDNQGKTVNIQIHSFTTTQNWCDWEWRKKALALSE